MPFRLLYVLHSCLQGMQIIVKRKCKWVLKYIWVYFALRDGIVDVCYVILVILWIIIIKEDVWWIFVIVIIWIL